MGYTFRQIDKTTLFAQQQGAVPYLDLPYRHRGRGDRSEELTGPGYLERQHRLLQGYGGRSWAGGPLVALSFRVVIFHGFYARRQRCGRGQGRGGRG